MTVDDLVGDFVQVGRVGGKQNDVHARNGARGDVVLFVRCVQKHLIARQRHLLAVELDDCRAFAAYDQFPRVVVLAAEPVLRRENVVVDGVDLRNLDRFFHARVLQFRFFVHFESSFFRLYFSILRCGAKVNRIE